MKILALLLFAASAFAANRPQQVYYLSATGNDANPGTQASPWLSPNHALNCGDVIIATASSSYSVANFGSGKWGTVTCGAGNSVAWLVCASFDGCIINSGVNGAGVLVTASYWGVSGWEVSNSGTGGGGCFLATPPTSGAGIHHIIFTNDIANSCSAGGFGSYNNGNAGVDYIAVVGSIAYNAAQNSTNCYSGISIFQPVASDANSGTHIYVAGNFSFGNVDPATCAGGPATDGEGGIYDTFDWKNVGAGPYTKQATMDNNIFFANGGYGMEVQSYTKNLASFPKILRRNNTIWGNNTTSSRNATSLCADSMVNLAYNVQDSSNIVQTTRTAGCPTANTIYAASKYDTSSASGSTDSGNWYFSASGVGTTTSTFNDDTLTFTYGSNTTGSTPAFASPAASTLASPSGCSAYTSVAACMNSVTYPVIGNFTSGAAPSYGYQTPSSSNGADQANFPLFLCRTGLPAGLVTQSC